MMYSGYVASLFTVAFLGGLLFGSAGRLNLPMFWAYLTVYLLIGLVATVLVNRSNPGLIARRVRIGKSEVPDLLYRVTLGVGFIANHVVAGLDVGRFHWSDSVPIAVQVLGLVAFTAGTSLSTWATMHNPFFAGEVRIQSELGHRVASGGPYQYVRHPGYAGGAVFMLASGVALGSWWSVLPMALVVITLIRRTALEDAMLHERLEGYSEYASKVRFRLVPGLW